MAYRYTKNYCPCCKIPQASKKLCLHCAISKGIEAYKDSLQSLSISKSPTQPPETARPGDNTGKDGAE